MPTVLSLLLLLVPGRAWSAAPVCTDWGAPVLLATCPSEEIPESSGLAAHPELPGVWITHNDAGGTATLHLFDEAGTHLDRVDLTGAAFRDWEAMAAGPCPAGVDAAGCLYIGDIGDNGESRDEIEVLVTGLPALGSGAALPVLTRWRLRYPDGPHDAEALAVHPCSGAVTVVTKEGGGDPQVYRLPATPTDVDHAATLGWVASLPAGWLGDSGRVTGASWSDTGARFVLRTYGGAWEWEADPAAPDDHWGRPPVPVPIDTEGQGEAIAHHPDGGLLTTTEGVPMRIVRLDCAASAAPPACPPPDPDPGDTGGPVDSGTPDDTGPGPDTGATVDSGRATDSAAPAGPADDSDPAASAASPDKDGGCGSAAALLVWLGLAGLSRRRRPRAGRRTG